MFRIRIVYILNILVTGSSESQKYKMEILLLLLLIFCTCSGNPSVETPVSVLIIGAGASGLQAAQTLHENGINDFLILEAADYIGGRVHDVEFAGVRVEQGANWAQPVGGNVQKLVNELGMTTHLTNWFSLVAYNSTGHNVTDEFIQTFDEVNSKVVEAFAIADDLWDVHDPDMSLRAGLSAVGWLPKTDIEKTIEWAVLDFENGDAPEFVSLKAHSYVAGEYNKRVPDDQKASLVIDPRGYKYIFNATMSFLGDEVLRDRILLNKKVTTIDQSGETVKVTCEGGDVFTASRVIVTASLAVLQNKLITFIPDLPGWKIRALNRFRMASYSKIYLEFPFNFWGDREVIFRTSDQRGRYPLFTNLEAEGLHPIGTNVLMAELTDAESRRVEAQSDDVIKAETEAILREIFGEANVPNVTNIFVSGWSRNPLTLGAYSVWTSDMEEECFAKMEARVGNVFFAGEHTSEDNGYVQGALDSGRREAMKVIECNNEGHCPQWQADQSCYCDDSANDAHSYQVRPLMLTLSLICPLILSKIMW